MKKGTTHKLFDHFFDNHTNEVIPAMCEFFDNNDIASKRRLNFQNEYEEGLFMEWVAFDHRLQNGKTLIEDFIAKNPLKLNAKELTVYKDLQMNKYGMYEIVKVKRDKYIDLENLQSGKLYRVIEKRGTHGAKAKTTWFCRVGKVGGHWELVGSNPIGYPVYHTKRMKALLRQDKTPMSPKDTRGLLNQNSNQPSKFEKSLTMSAEELKNKRDKIKNELVKQLSKIKSKTTIDDILAIIYYENGQAADNILKITAMLTDESDIPKQKIIDLVLNAWNNFPHKSLNGLSPAEKAQQVYGSQKKEDFSSSNHWDAAEIDKSNLPVGAFLPLFAIAPELDEQEIKTVTLTEKKYGLIPGTYRLVENFCADRRCDCRKVMINLANNKNKIIATIGFGWENVKYYESWVEDKELARQMAGAYLEAGGIQTEHSQGCLRLVKKILKDPHYLNCLRRHYKQFKASL